MKIIPAEVDFILCGNEPAETLGEKLGKLTLEYQRAPAAQSFELMDCFDQSIRKAGGVLVFTDNMLLFYKSDGRLLVQPCKNASIFVSELGDGPVKEALEFISPLRRMLTVGVGALTCYRILLLDDDKKTHARAVFQNFKIDNSNENVTWVSLQPLRGYESSYGILSEKIRELGGEKLQGAASMYACLLPEYADYNSRPVIAIARDEQAFQAANEIIRSYIGLARANEAGIVADYDSEFLHDYRVSLRKVRSVVSLFKGVYSDEQTVYLKRVFAEQMAPTGKLRDLDVYLLERALYFNLLPPSLHDGLSIMFDLFEKERRAQQKMIAQRLLSENYEKSINELSTLFTTLEQLHKGGNASHSAYGYACELIWKRYRKVCRIARAIDDTTEDEEVHELRIHGKKLRYLMEFFTPLFPEKNIRKLIKSLKQVQGNLGLFNDYSVQQESLQVFLDTHSFKSKDQSLNVTKSVGALIAVLYQRQLEERTKVVSSFAKFDSEMTRQQFRELFQH